VAACTRRGAVECRRSVTELKYFLKWPLLDQAIDERAVKDVAGTGGINCLKSETS
jgi:hypothetical protein